MLGKSAYERNARDFYPTPLREVEALIGVIGEDLPGMAVWEPFVGNGAISNVIKPLCRDIISTDIFQYDGFEPDLLTDFFAVYPDGTAFEQATEDYPNALIGYADSLHVWHNADHETRGEEPVRPGEPKNISRMFAGQSCTPDVIMSNPPYGKNAERAARHALALMEAQCGDVIFLCRHEWDAAKSRADLFDHPAFAAKITMRHRPRWIADSTGAPRHNYSWFLWSWAKAKKAPYARPEIFYVA